MKPETVLIANGDQKFANALSKLLKNKGYTPIVAHSGKGTIERCKKDHIHVVLLDDSIQDAPSLDVLKEIKKISPSSRVIFSVDIGKFEKALKALEFGAYEFLFKPYELMHIELIIEKVTDSLRHERVARLHQHRAEHIAKELSFVGRSERIKTLTSLIEQACTSDLPVLIAGEIGSGKTHIAQFIHYHSPRKNHPLLHLELKKRATSHSHLTMLFTTHPIVKDPVPSQLLLALHGGTIILDDVPDEKLPILQDFSRQMRLLRTSKKLPDIRLIVTVTASSLADAWNFDIVKELLDQSDSISIYLPPLRERPEDIPELCYHFFYFHTGGEEFLSPKEIDDLKFHRWPGNVRELFNVLERIYLLKKNGYTVDITTFVKIFQEPPRKALTDVFPQFESVQGIFPLYEIEKLYILHVYTTFSGNLSKTAKALGISLNTLKSKLRKYGVYT